MDVASISRIWFFLPLQKKVRLLRSRFYSPPPNSFFSPKTFSNIQNISLVHPYAIFGSEYGDLAGTKDALASLAHELTQRLHQDFAEGLGKINAAFNNFFAEMFRGGTTNLVANEEGGIEIAVDLPRKRVRSLEALSGGERALTSIALLFAMSQVNPPPFLVLDETDAALDEANSRRYGALLDNLSKQTQLVVVTHNRETMKQAGILYGVTMGGDGISRLLSVKFDEVAEA